MRRTKSEQLAALAEHLAARREPILQACLRAASADPTQTTVRSLTRSQFNDHIPQVLDAFERTLRSWDDGAKTAQPVPETREQEVKHGLHRWQQGYRLQELTHEWGHLQLCLFEEINAYGATHLDEETRVEANRQMITLVSSAISESTGQYARMQQAEAAGHLGDLERTLAAVNEIERQRAALIHQAVHDLRGDVQSVSSAADLLRDANLAQAEREQFARLVQQGIQSVSAMLGELMDLARLEAGQERKETVKFDVAALIAELCELKKPMAVAHGLYFKTEGPATLPVLTDPLKVRRLVQNLVQNALKYTIRGGVTVSWGREHEQWWIKVADTGPGILSGPGAPIALGLKEATASARESDEENAAAKHEVSHVLASPSGSTGRILPSHQQAGEGIGLSIVKRLCELLDASLEFASSSETGSTFRVVFF